MVAAFRHELRHGRCRAADIAAVITRAAGECDGHQYQYKFKVFHIPVQVIA
jgi:hypothetical protein